MNRDFIIKKKLLFIFVIFSIFVSFISFITGCKKRNEKEIEVYPFFRLGFQANTSSKEYLTALKFAEKVSEFSNGTIDIKIFPDGQLGDDIEMLQKVSTGCLDMMYAETGRLGLWVKEAEIFGYPFAFDDFDHLKRTLSTDFGKNLHKKFLENGWRVLATGYNGTRQTTSNKPINSIEDMKGMKLRVPEAKPNINFAEYSGAIPEILPFGEVYTYLKSGMVDGQENPLSTIESKKFYEVQEYCALTNHIINDNNIIISEKSFNILSEEQKEAITKAAEIAADYSTELFENDEKELIEQLKQQGMKFTMPDRKPFREACQPMYNNYIHTYGRDAVDAILSQKN